uniref:Uncharacterized protein n=1 Tax=Alexandrium monilatum TaxID=311494 RepID=A0A7S4WC09_9DINO
MAQAALAQGLLPERSSHAQLALMSPLQMRIASLAVVAGAAVGGEGTARGASCPGRFLLEGLGNVSLVPAGWGAEVAPPPELQEGGVIRARMGSRSYFAATCTAGRYDNEQYLALDMRGKTLTYTTDLSKAGCGCNAALYLTSMRRRPRVLTSARP